VNVKVLTGILLVFMLGWASHSILSQNELNSIIQDSNNKTIDERLLDEKTNGSSCTTTTTCNIKLENPKGLNQHTPEETTKKAKKDYDSVLRLFFKNKPKTPSDRISEKQIKIYPDKVVIEIKNAEWSSFTPTGSMEPVLNENSNAIEVVPKSEDEIKVGDIVSYYSTYANTIIIHRVVKIGHDKEGWYCITKGDNNPRPDPYKVRFSQIKRVVVAIIY